MDEFYAFLGKENTARIRLAVMDMWKPFRNSTQANTSQAAILFDKFHVLRHLGKALDKIRKSEYGRITGSTRKFIKGQKYVLLSHKENLTPQGKQSLKLLLKANKRLNTAYLLREFLTSYGTTPQRRGRAGSLTTGKPNCAGNASSHTKSSPP